MKRWIKRGIGVLTLCALLSVQTMAAEIALSFDKAGTTAAVQVQDVGSDRYAAEITLPLSSTQSVQFRGKADTYAITVDAAAGTVTLYAASRTPLTVTNGALDLGTLTVAAGTEVTGTGTAVVLDRSLDRYTYSQAEITISHSDSGDTGGTGGTTTTDRTPSVSVNGTGGKVKAANDGTVTITPDAGYRIARILVNGREVAVSTRLTGLRSTDKVVVTFEKVEDFEDVETTVTFTDVRPTDWYAGAVEFVVTQGLFQGVSATEFRPDVEMSRAMLVTVLYRLSGETADGSASAFTDVLADAWYGPAVAWAQKAGVVQGVSATEFAPDHPVTREQMATILYRYAGAQAGTGAEDALAAFTDGGSVSSYAVPAMGWAVEKGLLSGVSGNTLAPRGVATRAQVAVILQRFLEVE